MAYQFMPRRQRERLAAWWLIPRARWSVGASVEIRNPATDFSETRQSDSLREFSFENLPAGDYNVDAWHRFFERGSQPNVEIIRGSAKSLNFRLNLCGMRHLDPYKESFAIRTEIRTGNDFEKGFATKAGQIPCSTADSPIPNGRPAHRCANLPSMEYYSILVRKNKAGHLPEAGEGPVVAGAYFGANVAFDKTGEQWIVKLRQEYKVQCGMLCGISATYDRWVYFDQRGEITKVDDDCSRNAEWVS